MYRLAYLIPRLMLLGLAFLAASIAGDTIAERLVTAHLESSIGMDIEIGRFRTRAANGKVFVNDFALVDPAHPLINVFQADLAFLEIDLSAVSKRQLVIENARASQVRIGVPRTSAVGNSLYADPSALEASHDATELKEPQVGRFLGNHEGIRMSWLDQFEENVTPIVVEPEKPETNQLYQLASVTNQKWNKDFQQQTGQLKVVPLRGPTSNGPQESELDQLIKKLESLQSQQQILERQAAADIARLEQVYKTASATQHQQTQPSELQVSPETLSQLLLVDLQQSIANEAMEWFSGVRSSTSACAKNERSIGETELGRTRGRGELIEVVGALRKQPTVIKKLSFDGAGRFNQQHINFAGEAYDITDQPTVYDRPATFKLRAQGDHHFVLQGSIDRRSGVCSDSVTIDFPAFPLGPQTLGTESEMLVTTGPLTTTHGSIHLKIDGQAVSGTMRLDFSDVALVVEHLHDLAGGKEVALRLNQSLSTLQQFESTAVFGGTLDRPHLKFESNLGVAFANAMTQINKGRMNPSQVATRDEVEQFYETQVLPLQANIKKELASISRSINSQIGHAQKMLTSLRAAKSRWPKIR